MALPPDVKELAARVRNWGRWGDDDELGTLNFITDEVVLAAAQEIKTGKQFSLSLPLNKDGPQVGHMPDRTNPNHTMTMVNVAITGDPENFCTSDDKVDMGIQAGTHWDALAHVSYAGNLYNGIPAQTINEGGASRLGIDKIPAIVGRGILLDVARTKSMDRLEGGYAITAADLDAAVEFAGVEVRSGDIVLIRTGQMLYFLAGDRDRYNHPTPGPSLQSVEWFYDHEIAAVAVDNLAFEVFPSEREDAFLPVHLIHLVDMGMLQGQNWNLEALSADCAADSRYAFFLDASPLSFSNAVGGPVNPIAVK